MAAGWIDDARHALLLARGPSGAWPYRGTLAPATEPTALAALALPEAAPGAARWLESSQHADGSLGVSATLPEPCWATPHAILLWSAVGGFEPACARACAWLIGMRGVTSPRQPGAITAHDTGLDGWPWLSGTHPWLEPTAMAVLALAGRGHRGHPRVREGLRLIADRALPSGGWNYGNTAVFGRELRPQPAPTGLALLALARAGVRPRPSSGRPATSSMPSRPSARVPRSAGGCSAWPPGACALPRPTIGSPRAPRRRGTPPNSP